MTYPIWLSTGLSLQRNRRSAKYSTKPFFTVIFASVILLCISYLYSFGESTLNIQKRSLAQSTKDEEVGYFSSQFELPSNKYDSSAVLYIKLRINALSFEPTVKMKKLVFFPTLICTTVRSPVPNRLLS
jgi:hypothetical protein